MNFESKFKQERIEKAEDMIEGVESKVQFIKSLHVLALSLDEKETSPIDSKQLESVLLEKLALHIAGDEKLKEASNRIDQVETLKAEMAAEEAQLRLIPREEKSNEDFEKHRKSQAEKLFKLLNVYDINNDDIEYLKQIKDYIKYIVELKKERDKFKELYDQDGGALLPSGGFVRVVTEFFNEWYCEYRKFMVERSIGFKGHNIGKAKYGNYLVGVDFRGLGVVLVFKDRARARLRDFNNLGGRHFGNSCISFCFENEGKDFVHSHEYNHTLFGRHEDHKILYKGGFLRKIKKIAEPSPEQMILKAVFKKDYSRDEDLEKTILGYQKELMGEIFADLSNIFDHNLASGFYGHFKQSLDALDKYSDELEDEHLKVVIEKSKDELVLSVNKYMDNLGELVFLARSLDMVEDAMAGMLVFGGDARKALRHFKSVVEPEKIAPLLEGYDPFAHRIFQSLFEKNLYEKIIKRPNSQSLGR